MAAIAMNPPDVEAEKPKSKPRRAPFVLGGLVLVLTTIGTAAYANGRGKESTDDAFVEAHVASVAPRIAGQVTKVHVSDNAHVKVGDVLVELDDRDAKVKVATAEADLLSANANLVAVRTNLALTEKNVQANLLQARGGVVSASAMTGSSKAQIDQARADIEAAESRLRLADEMKNE